jgi:hypothetical protein
MSDPTSGLVAENNRLYDAINTYNNTLIPSFEAILAEYGLTEPVTLAQLEGLTLRQLASLSKGINEMKAAMDTEAGQRPFESNLADMGYVDVDAAIADVPNRFTGESATIITNTLERIKSTLALLDSLVDINEVLNIVTKITEIKNAVKADAASLQRV